MLTHRIRPLHLLVAVGLLAACQPGVRSSIGRAAGDVRLGAEPVRTDPTDLDAGDTIEAVVPVNATLDSLLRQADVPADLSASLVEAARSVFNPRALRADRPYRITRTIGGLFREFQYEIDADNLLRLVFHDGSGSAAASIDAEVAPVPKEYELASASAEISEKRTSLVDAFSSSGENIQLPLQLAEIFAGELDFNSDLRRGDRIDALFERAMRKGEFVGYGDVKAAVLKTGARRIVAVRYVGPDGKPGWFDEHGQSLRRQFLKSPLPFDPRVTSAFSSNRLHPLFGVERPHLGVDFGAPYGTSVKAVAAGVVELADWAGEAGRMVRIRHTGGYETAYLHLSSFGPGIRAGAHVEQGQQIGRVGQTGAATGPHLDFRVVQNGVYVNPLTAFSRTPQADPLAADALPDFSRARDQVLADLQARLATR